MGQNLLNKQIDRNTVRFLIGYIGKLIAGKQLIFILSLLFLFGYYIFYIHSATANIVFQDQFRQLGTIIEKYFDGSLSFIDLWNDQLEHRWFAYQLIFLGNALFFHLNTRLEMYIGAIILLSISIIVYLRYRKSLIDFSNEIFIQASFLIVAFIIFSLNQQANINFSSGMALMLAILMFLVTFIILDKIILNEINSNNALLLLFSLSTFVTVMFFGAGYSFGFLCSLLSVLILKISVIDRKFNKRNLKTLSVAIVTLIVTSFIYLHNFDENLKGSSSDYFINKIIGILSNPLNPIKFFLLTIAGSFIHGDHYSHYLNQSPTFVTIISLIGLVLLSLYVYSIKLFISSHMYKKTYLPIFLIFYALFTCILILVGRFDYSITYGMQPRYITSTQYGIIGSLWILMYYLQSYKDKKTFKKYALTAVLLVSFSGEIMANIQEWKIAPYRKAAFEQMRNVAISYGSNAYDINNSNDLNELKKGLKLFNDIEERVIHGLKILKKYNLNVWYDYNLKIGNTLDMANLISSPERKLSLEGYIPDHEFLKRIELKIFDENKLLAEKTLTNGAFKIEYDVNKNSTISLMIFLDKSFIPREKGINNDNRELSIIINNLVIK